MNWFQQINIKPCLFHTISHKLFCISVYSLWLILVYFELKLNLIWEYADYYIQHSAADLGINGRGAHRGSGGCSPSGGAGAEPPLEVLGAKPPPEAEAQEYFRIISESALVPWCKRQLHRWQTILNFCTIFVFTACLHQSVSVVSHTTYSCQ